MKISVITVCKNAAKSIERALQSVLSQTYGDVEYLVIDGDSQDRTQDVVRKYTHSIKKFVSEPDGGIYEAMNKGIRLAAGEYIYFLGADDYLYDENVLDDVAGFIRKQRSCDLVYGDIVSREPSGQALLLASPPPAAIAEHLMSSCMPHQATFCRADLFAKIGLFSEHYRIASDYAWWIKLLQNPGTSLHYYPRTIAFFNSKGSSSNIQRTLREMWQIQNEAPLYQTDYWYKKRIARFQEIVTALREQVTDDGGQDFHALPQAYRDELKRAYRLIEGMRSSKFWKMRTAWKRLKMAVKPRTSESY